MTAPTADKRSSDDMRGKTMTDRVTENVAALIEQEVALDDPVADSRETAVDVSATPTASKTSADAVAAAVDVDVDDEAEIGSRGRGAALVRGVRAGVRWPAAVADRTRRIIVGVLAALIIAGAAGLGFVWWAADTAAADTAAGQSALASARTDIPNLLSYDYRTIDADFPKAAKTMLTGTFLDEYTELGASVIQPTAKKDRIVTKAEVVESALVSSDEDTATVLLFVNQTTTSQSAEGPRLDGSRIRVQMVRAGDRWKISEFTPV